jgi:hypothetical protein
MYTWAVLAAIPGASVVTYLIVAYTKHLIRQSRFWQKAGTDLYASLVAAVVLNLALVAVAVQGGQQLTPLFLALTIPLGTLNGLVVAATAGKMHDAAVSSRRSRTGTTAHE